MLSIEQLKETIVFTAFKAMQFEIGMAQQQAAAQQLAKKLEEAEGALKEAAAQQGSDQAAAAQLHAVERTLADATPMELYESAWTVADLLAGKINLMPNAADLAGR